jgi:sugar-specific transcriptional regulator TrmB
MHLGHQTKRVYEILLGSREGLTVAEIAFKLRTASADVYRLTRPLLDFGLVEASRGRPVKLFAKPPDQGLGLYLMNQSHWFQSQFASPETGVFKLKEEKDNMQLEFIQGRDELMRVSVDEMVKTTKSVDLLRSGHEIPADLMLEMIRAIGREVKIRMIIQDYGQENKEMVGNWIKNGILVRKAGIKHLRLMIYDAGVGYFMSYKHSDSGQDIGMKIIYPAFTAILSQYFEDLWRKSEKISAN